MNKILFKLKDLLPVSVRRVLLNFLNFSAYREYSNQMANPYKDDPDKVEFENSFALVGIVYSKMNYHKFWIAACRELKVSFQIIYLEKNDWLEQVQESNCQTLLVWPDVSDDASKTMQDERLRILDKELNKTIYPSLNAIWLYENKRVQHYWLKSHGFKTPETWVFYRLDEVLSFLQKACYPLVFKSNLGASASGVYIVKNKKEALKKASIFLQKGYKVKGEKGIPRQVGSLYIQEFLPNVKEWRMVRIGDSYFGHGKDMEGQFHSGSGKANWDMPSKQAFDLLYEVTEKGGFTSMDVDIFEDSQGNLYVNELQTVFGTSIAKEQLKIDGIPGRMLRNDQGEFLFEAGDFCQNHLCNLRLKYILK